MGRGVITKLSDLLPDVLIEAQRCDGITARKALERTAEELAYDHNFFTAKFQRTYNQETPIQKWPPPSWRLFPIDDISVLEVLSCAVDGNMWDVATNFDSGNIYVACPRWKKDGGVVDFEVSYLPYLDEDLLDERILTKDRRVIVAGALRDLFSMSGKPWANETRAVKWTSDFWAALGKWKTRRISGGVERPIRADNPLGFL